MLIVLANCSPSPVATDPPVVDRRSAIPTGAHKYDPNQDQAPPILHDPSFNVPHPMSGVINTAGAEDSPFITPSGDMLFFFYTPSIEQPPEEELTDGIAGIYWTHYDEGTWSEPTRLFLNEPGQLALDGCPTYFEGTLWYCSARQGNFKGIDFWTARVSASEVNHIENAGKQLNQIFPIGEMHLAPNGTDLYFHSTNLNGKGGIDLWITRWTGDDWSVPENLENLNTAEDEGWPFISTDGQQLWFTRTYQGSPAIFRSEWLGTEWGRPSLIVSQFAGEPTLDSAGNLYFVHHFLDQGLLVEADLYLAVKR